MYELLNITRIIDLDLSNMHTLQRMINKHH